jgi:hypothetical protein
MLDKSIPRKNASFSLATAYLDKVCANHAIAKYEMLNIPAWKNCETTASRVNTE